MELVKFFQTGGGFMYPILLVLALGLGIGTVALSVSISSRSQTGALALPTATRRSLIVMFHTSCPSS